MARRAAGPRRAAEYDLIAHLVCLESDRRRGSRGGAWVRSCQDQPVGKSLLEGGGREGGGGGGCKEGGASRVRRRWSGGGGGMGSDEPAGSKNAVVVRLGKAQRHAQHSAVASHKPGRAQGDTDHAPRRHSLSSSVSLPPSTPHLELEGTHYMHSARYLTSTILLHPIICEIIYLESTLSHGTRPHSARVRDCARRSRLEMQYDLSPRPLAQRRPYK